MIQENLAAAFAESINCSKINVTPKGVIKTAVNCSTL